MNKRTLLNNIMPLAILKLKKRRKKKKKKKTQELWSLEDAGVNRVFVWKTSLATPYGIHIRSNTTSTFVGSIHYFDN